MLAFDREQERTYRTGDQYLLSKAMLLLQAMVIIAAIGAFSAAIVATWHTLVPPAEVRQAARDYRSGVEQQRVTSANAASDVSTLDNEWTAKRAGVVARYTAERRQRITNAKRAMTMLEKDLTTYDALGASIVQYGKSLPEYSNPSSADEVDRVKGQLDRTLSANWWSLSEWGRNAVQGWNDTWYSLAIAEVQLKNVPLDDLRAETQPRYRAAVASRDAAAQTLAMMEEGLKQADEAASLKWKAAGWRALGSFAAILLFLWILGLAIEAAWLAIRVAGDVRRLRELNEAQPPVAKRAEAHPRVPIREPAAVTQLRPTV